MKSPIRAGVNMAAAAAVLFSMSLSSGDTRVAPVVSPKVRLMIEFLVNAFRMRAWPA